MKSKKAVINLSSVVKNYELGEITIPVLKALSLKIFQGEFVAISGPSGSGKSTLMNIIGLLDTPTDGKYTLNDTEVSRLHEDELSYLRNKEIGFVFQSFNLLARSTAIDNVILPAIYAGMNEQERRQRAIDLLIKVGLEERMYNRPNQLSGGQQQRVAIARALVNNPSIILADEPTGNLDTKSGTEIMKILTDLNSQGKTIVMITHEKEIAAYAKRVISMKDGEIV